MGIELEAGEQQIGKWIINLRPPGGARVNGNLVVTDQRILFEPKSNIGLENFLYDTRYKGVIAVPRSDVTGVTTEKSFLSKKVHVALNDGSTMTFDYGAMSVDKLEAALKS